MPRRNTEIDFWNRVDKSGGYDSCWEWTGCRSDRGYGKTFFNGKDMRAHRLAFKLTHNTLPTAVCHKCDNPPCCNPLHLFPGDYLSNNRDRSIKKRSAYSKGEFHSQSKLRDGEVLEMHQMYKSGTTGKEIANKFKINESYAYQILCGVRWKHLYKI